jgi:hypothetical protein
VDLNKPFEHVQHYLLVRVAREHGYHLNVLRTSLMEYAGARRVTFQGYVSAPLWPTRGIAAGSSTATYELWLLLSPALRAIQSAHPAATLSLHLDDLSATIAAPSVEDGCVDVARLSQTIQLEIQLAFAPDKGFSIASGPAIARAAVRLTTRTVQPEGDVRRLGIDYHLEPAPSRRVARTPVQAGRFREVVKRVIRLRRFFPNGSAGLFAAGIGPVAYYGSDHAHMAPPLVQSLQRKAVSSGQVRPFGTPAEFALLAHPVTYDPGYKTVAQPILRWAREVWMSDHPQAFVPTDSPPRISLNAS